MWGEIFYQALNSIRGNKLRTSLTIAIIAVGITSLVGTLTAARALEQSISESFGKMGAESFLIRRGRGDSDRRISYQQVQRFLGQYRQDAIISPYVRVEMGLDGVSANGRRTTPEVDVVGVDGSFVGFNGGSIALGRNFSAAEEAGGDVALLGANVDKMLFGGVGAEGGEIPPDAMVNVRGRRFRVVGVLEEMGGGGGSLDNMLLLPIDGVRNGLLSGEESFVIGVSPGGAIDSDSAVDEAAAVMRSVRGLTAGEEDDFLIRRRDSALSQMESMMDMVTLAAFMIGFITLLGAAVGLMNIMLVSVKERTAEIGVRKALGASDEAIKGLFLAEALLVGLAGGVIGVVLGLVAGAVVATVMEIGFVVPWGWIVVSMVVCMVVSLLSGTLPATRAAALPPIEALRDEYLHRDSERTLRRA